MKKATFSAELFLVYKSSRNLNNKKKCFSVSFRGVLKVFIANIVSTQFRCLWRGRGGLEARCGRLFPTLKLFPSLKMEKAAPKLLWQNFSPFSSLFLEVWSYQKSRTSWGSSIKGCQFRTQKSPPFPFIKTIHLAIPTLFYHGYEILWLNYKVLSNVRCHLPQKMIRAYEGV